MPALNTINAANRKTKHVVQLIFSNPNMIIFNKNQDLKQTLSSPVSDAK
jgi:hypothetical protein